MPVAELEPMGNVVPQELAPQSVQPQQIAVPDKGPVWQAVKELLRAQMSEPSFETWIGPLEIQALAQDSVTLETDSTFKRDWVLKHYRRDLQEAFVEATGLDIIQLKVQVAAPKEPELFPANTAQIQTVNQQELIQPEETFRPWTPRTSRSNLNPKYTFENFVVGEQNQFCHAAALAVAESPAQSYNPFFIYGGVGLGKTHLIQAIGNFVLTYHPDSMVKYVTSEQFTNDLITALGKKEWSQFRDRYRKIDVLIIDDIQFLGGKDRTQQELFHTFNALHEAGKQIILSSDRPPKHLADLEDRLRSRFEWGLIADIQPPDVETRLAILYSKMEQKGIEIPKEVLMYLAENHPSNIRELEGGLNKIAAYVMLTKMPMNLETAQRVLGIQMDPARLSIDGILDEVARYYHLRAEDLKSTSRSKDISFARQIAIYMVRTLTDASFPKIGQVFGGRKHTTMLYAYEKVCKTLEGHPVLSQQIKELTLRIKSGQR